MAGRPDERHATLRRITLTLGAGEAERTADTQAKEAERLRGCEGGPARSSQFHVGQTDDADRDDVLT